MARLFRVGADGVAVYIERTPAANGRDASILTPVTIWSSVFLVLIGIAPLCASFASGAVGGLFPRLGVPAWSFLFFALCGVWNLTGEYCMVFFDAGKRKLRARGRFGWRDVSDFSDISEVLLVESEDDDGAKAYQYGAVFTDAGSDWYPITPKVYEEAQLTAFREGVVERVNELISAGGKGPATQDG